MNKPEEKPEVIEISIKGVPQETKNYFKAYCAKLGQNMSEVIISFMKDYIKGTYKIEKPKKTKRRRRVYKSKVSINIKTVPADVKRQFYKECAKQKISVSQTVIAFMRSKIKGARKLHYEDNDNFFIEEK